MRCDYSKPLGDIGPEMLARLKANPERDRKQKELVNHVLNASPRAKCVLCSTPLEGDSFHHRQVVFVRCAVCSHLQTQNLPPIGYPSDVPGGIEFGHIYPKLDAGAYEDRKKRIYSPKLSWILNCLSEAGYSKRDLQDASWIEFGCGAGYFISCLYESGFNNCQGLEADPALVEIARKFTPDAPLHLYNGSLSDGIAAYPAKIYVAFFVLEHIDDLKDFFVKLSALPAGTIFVFSVPVFGFSCLLEGAFEEEYARNLDGVLHTQLFTDESISFALKVAGFQPVAQWIFGQDAEDLHRFLLRQLEKKYPKALLETFNQRLFSLQDSIQHILDKNKFSDQRHIIAIKDERHAR